MSFKNVPIPAAAEAAGFTKLALADDFDDLSNIDFSGEGKPGYVWYADRPMNMPTMTESDFKIVEESVVRMQPEMCSPLIGLSSYSKKGDTGYTMQYGYLEARIRVKIPGKEYNRKTHCWPAFWTLGLENFMGRPFERCGELDVIEMVTIHEGHPIYTGTLHDWHRYKDEEGKTKTAYASNLVNSTGYNDYFDYIDEEWHTYAALWEPGHVAWYWDNKLMHSARYNEWDLPQYFYREDPTPLPRLEHRDPKFEKRTWKGAHSIMEHDPEVVILGCRGAWPMDIDWVRVWEKE